MENKLTLLQKLLEIQKAVDYLQKDEKGMNYQYVSGTTVLGAVKPLMNKLGLLLIEEVTNVECQRMDYQVGRDLRPKSEMFTKVSLLFTWVDTETGDKLPVNFAANGQNDWDKGLGSALTYAERYFLLKFFHIPTDEDDPDKRQLPESQAPRKVEDNRPMINEKQLAAVIERFNTGEFDAIDKAIKAFRFTQTQFKQIEDARK